MPEDGSLPPLRTIRIAETNRNFFIAAKAPFDVESKAFEMLGSISGDVRELKEGSQVFIYDRKVFGADSDAQHDGVLEHVSAVAEEIGSIAIHPTIKPITVE